MTQNEMKNAGYQLVQTACIAKGFNAVRSVAAVNAYAIAVKAHSKINATLVHMLAMNVIENA